MKLSANCEALWLIREIKIRIEVDSSSIAVISKYLERIVKRRGKAECAPPDAPQSLRLRLSELVSVCHLTLHREKLIGQMARRSRNDSSIRQPNRLLPRGTFGRARFVISRDLISCDTLMHYKIITK